jgi:hypothetical protein
LLELLDFCRALRDLYQAKSILRRDTEPAGRHRAVTDEREFSASDERLR